MKLSIDTQQNNIACHYAVLRFFIFTLSVVMLSVVAPLSHVVLSDLMFVSKAISLRLSGAAESASLG